MVNILGKPHGEKLWLMYNYVYDFSLAW
jgi:hypothetical protein